MQNVQGTPKLKDLFKEEQEYVESTPDFSDLAMISGLSLPACHKVSPGLVASIWCRVPHGYHTAGLDGFDQGSTPQSVQQRGVL